MGNALTYETFYKHIEHTLHFEHRQIQGHSIELSKKNVIQIKENCESNIRPVHCSPKELNSADVKTKCKMWLAHFDYQINLFRIPQGNI